ncbi:LuxR C-terminal-related transcriptional regulator [Pantoea sp. MBD-2R]|uniref:helix-turn-helix transcriptional regulator n=1 Tax=Pantoea sp. MBD-2R TaxID=3141540 RepID=UPI0031841794
MCIYVISDDIYFTAGLAHFLRTNGIPLKIYNYQDWSAIFQREKLTAKDTVIIDVNFTGCHSRLGMAKSLGYFGVNIAFIIDLPLQFEKKGFYPYWLISKKSGFKKFIPLLRGPVNNKILRCSQLSFKEMLILKELSSGKSVILISKKLNISVKTVSSHKQNAVRKLGMMHMNDMSLVCYKEILNLFSGAINNNFSMQDRLPAAATPFVFRHFSDCH